MLKSDEYTKRLPDRNRVWFLNLHDGQLVDALGERVGLLRQYGETWREVKADVAAVLFRVPANQRVEKLRELQAPEPAKAPVTRNDTPAKPFGAKLADVKPVAQNP